MKRVVRVGESEGQLDLTHADGQVRASLGWDGGAPETFAIGFQETESGVYSLLVNDRAYEARVLADREGWVVEIHGQRYSVQVMDPREARPRQQGFGKEGRKDVASPMPGKVVRVLVEEGSIVEEGQGLVVVEAMKMQNEMKAPKSGKVVALAARAGASVTAGEVLVTLE